jgi:hypothetical protein
VVAGGYLFGGVVERDCSDLVLGVERLDEGLLTDVPYFDGTVVGTRHDQLGAAACWVARVDKGRVAG